MIEALIAASLILFMVAAGVIIKAIDLIKLTFKEVVVEREQMAFTRVTGWIKPEKKKAEMPTTI